MSEIVHSAEGLSVLKKFYRKEYIIYVEGIDDIPFWDAVFSGFGLQNFTLAPAGGSSNLENYINKIVNEDAMIYVAADSDYQEILNTQTVHSRIVWTYGYSIENTLYHPLQISKVISIYSFTQDYDSSLVHSWLEEFALSFWMLLIYEISNFRNGQGIKILGKKSHPFLESENSPIPSGEYIANKVDEISENFPTDEISICEILLKEHIKHKPVYYVIRGHFLSKAVINFIKQEVKQITRKKVRIEEMNLYAHLISKLNAECIQNSNREDLKFIKSQISTW